MKKLLTTVATQDKSAQLFDAVVTALLSSYEFSEITSVRGQLACSQLGRGGRRRGS